MIPISLDVISLYTNIPSDGTIDRKLYSKPANKGITLHYESHHPSSTKNAMIRNELQRAEQCSTTANRTAAVTTTIDKLSRNGYPKKWLTAKKQRRKKKDKTKPSFTLRIPFVSDQLNHQIKRTLRRHGIPARLVNPRGQTIKDLTKPRKAKTTKKMFKQTLSGAWHMSPFKRCLPGHLYPVQWDVCRYDN